MPQRPKIAASMLELIGYTPLVRLNVESRGSVALMQDKTRELLAFLDS